MTDGPFRHTTPPEPPPKPPWNWPLWLAWGWIGVLVSTLLGLWAWAYAIDAGDGYARGLTHGFAIVFALLVGVTLTGRAIYWLADPHNERAEWERKRGLR